MILSNKYEILKLNPCYLLKYCVFMDVKLCLLLAQNSYKKWAFNVNIFSKLMPIIIVLWLMQPWIYILNTLYYHMKSLLCMRTWNMTYSIKCHYTVTVITLVLLSVQYSNYCLTTVVFNWQVHVRIQITIKTTVELL